MNNKDNSEFIFTLSCPDTSGIVAEVAGFMAKSNLTKIEKIKLYK